MPQHRYRNTVRFLIEPTGKSVQKIPIFLNSLCLGLIIPVISQAQIISDNTLPNNSIVTPQGNINVIQGGTTAGINLFHSFQQFSIPTNQTAYFNNALNIQNIFTRITGSSISNIDGIIQANGTANLFLINPNGIIFSPNAALNIGGSFLASTTSQINFADGTQFSATSPQTTSLLTLSMPVGLQMGPNPGNIVVQGPGHNLGFNEAGAIIRDNRLVGLQVAAGQTLVLLGGHLTLEGGNLTAEDGRIELGSIGGETQVRLTLMNPGIELSYPDLQNFQDISLLMAASVDVSGLGGGDIAVVGRRMTLTDGSAILDLTEDAQSGGTMSIRISEMLEVIGSKTIPDGEFPSGLFAQVTSGVSGDGGNLIIETANLRIADGAQVGTGTFGSGKVGNLTIKATDTVEISASGLFAQVTPGATGDGGDLTIETARLRLINGGQIGTGTFGSGKAGNLTIKATDRVELIGISPNRKFSSGLFASVEAGATGEGGNLTIETPRLQVVGKAMTTVSSHGEGKAGNLIVDADFILLDNLGSVTADTNRGGGSIELRSPTITLRRGSSISTNASGGESGGNIEVISSSLILRQGSRITTNAISTATGGNINLNTGILTALENSDISANSQQSQGGNVTINAQGIFGTQFREQPTAASDITATGGTPDLTGTVTVNTPDLNPSQGLLKLPEMPVDVTQLVSSACNRTGSQYSRFTVTGRGGLPPNPYEIIADEATWMDLRNSEITISKVSDNEIDKNLMIHNQSQLVEAQGWKINPQGQVQLVAQVAASTPQNLGFLSQECYEQ